MRTVMTREQKASLHTVTIDITGQSPVFNVKSGTSDKTYKVVFNSSGILTCNCPCGINHLNETSPCTHVDAAILYAVPA